MRGLIYITGTIEDVFFRQEIEYFRKAFDRVWLISIEGEPQRAKEIAGETGVELYLLSKTPKIREIPGFLRFLSEPETRLEMRRNVFCRSGIKRLAYILFYGLTSVKVLECVRQIQADPSGGFADLYVYSYYLSRGAYAAARIDCQSQKSVKRIVSRGHGYDLYEERNDLHYLPFRSFICRHLDAVSLISYDGYEYFRKRCSPPKGKLFMYYLGSKNNEKLQKQIRDKKEILLASCSLMVKIKRIDRIIRVMRALGSTVRWIHIGDGEQMEKMQILAQKELRQGQYTFVGSVKNEEMLNTFLKYDVDFFINLSDSEGLPVSMMEAFSVGIPVIGTNVGGVSEIITEGCGLLLDTVDREGIRRIYEYVQMRLNNPQRYMEESKQCIRRWSEQFNADVNHPAFIRNVLLGDTDAPTRAEDGGTL